jgi:hypothetical protein
VSKKPAAIPVSEKPAAIPVSEKPAAIPVSEKPAAIPVSGKPTAVSVNVKPAAIPVSEKPAAIPVSEKPAAIPVSKKPATIPVSEKPAAIPVSEKPATIPVSEKPATIPVSKKPAAIPVSEKPAAVKEQKLNVNSDIYKELISNFAIATTPWSGSLTSFQTVSWESSNLENEQSLANFQDEITQAYVDIHLANSIVWVCNETRHHSTELDESYKQLCIKIAERLKKVIVSPKNAK